MHPSFIGAGGAVGLLSSSNPVLQGQQAQVADWLWRLFLLGRARVKKKKVTGRAQAESQCLASSMILDSRACKRSWLTFDSPRTMHLKGFAISRGL